MQTKVRISLIALFLLAMLIVPASAQSGLSNFTHIATTGYVRIGSFERLTPGTTVVVTTDGTITPVASYQPLSSSGNVQTASIATGSAGDVLYMINTSNTTITITDTGTLKLGGNRALGQYDTLTLVSDGTNWIERSYTNN